MIGPHAHNEKHLDEFGRRVGHGPGADRPTPRGSTGWWVVRAVAVVGVTVFGCVGFAGVLQSASLHCNDVGRRACIGLVVNDLTGKTPTPARTSAD
uniref:hypothetical protein n=1 Tax=Paractinoplanes polyasparticus TaxID=2856853 RepID=UPI001C85CCCB|nr:hypothetical protein [Actinoplanes polyasparticus]